VKTPTFKIVGFEPKTVFQPDLGEQQLPIYDGSPNEEFPEVEARHAPKPPKRNRI
jgi:hypothetical protein